MSHAGQPARAVLRASLAVAIGLLACMPAWAQTAPIEGLNAALVGSMKAADFKARAALLAPAIDAAFDLPGILKSAVGVKWGGIAAPQQQQLLTAFRAFTIASYAGNFNSYGGQVIKVVPPVRKVGADEIVQTAIVSGSKTDRIDYQMRELDGAWKAEDVLLDGSISNVAVQRSDFRKLLASGNAQQLIDSLTKRAADLANNTAS